MNFKLCIIVLNCLKVEFLKPSTKLEKSDHYPSVTLLLKDKQDNTENFEKVLTALQASGNVSCVK